MSLLQTYTHKISDFSRLNEPILRYAILILLSLFVILFSSWQGAYNLDPHHWGLMLSNAKDLSEGRLPYKEIFIQYGILTTIIHSLSLSFLGHNLHSLIMITAIAYVIGLIGTYHIAFTITQSRKLAIYSFITSVLLHSLAIYPWSNYIAYPFLVFGALLYINPYRYHARSFLSGLLLAAAILSREGLFLPVLAFAIIVTLFELATLRGKKNPWLTLALFWAGLASPLAIFFVYLYIQELIPFWYKTSIVLPGLYVDQFFHEGVFGALWKLTKYFISGLTGRNSRIVFFGLIVSASLIACVGVALRWKLLYKRWDVFALSGLVLLLLTSALHLNEVFRLATSITLGTVLVYLIGSYYRAENIIFFVFTALFLITLADRTSGNYFMPSLKQQAQATTRDNPAIFIGQKWPPEVFDYYSAVQRDLLEIKKISCGITYHYNDTKDVFIAVLSPFEQYQFAPFGRGIYDMSQWSALRPDYAVNHKIEVDRDIIIFATVRNDETVSYRPPAGYYVVNRYPMPKSFFFREDEFLFIVAPRACAANAA